MAAPCSLYSSALIHELPKELREAKVEAPFQTANLRSAEAMHLISAPAGAKATISSFSLSGRPLYMVVPPDRIKFLVNSFLISISEDCTDCHANAGIDLQDLPLSSGLNRSQV